MTSNKERRVSTEAAEQTLDIILRDFSLKNSTGGGFFLFFNPLSHNRRQKSSLYIRD